MGRRKSAEPYVRWKVLVPATLAAQVELLHHDPVLNKPAYGERSTLIVHLLEGYVAKQRGITPRNLYEEAAQMLAKMGALGTQEGCDLVAALRGYNG